MGKTRMYEPYGYLEEGEYISKKSMLYNELQKNRDNDHKEFKDINDLYEKHNTEAVNSAYYDDDLESVIFKNVKGEAISSIKMTDIFPSKLVKSAEYDKETQHLIITFDNDDTIDIDLNDLINNLDAGDGLILEDAKFAVLISDSSEKFVSGSGESFLSVDSSGVKISHIQDAIDVEKNRAISAETLERETRIDQDRILLGLINAEESRAMTEERRIDNTIGTGFTTAATQTITQKFKDLNNKLTDEIANRQTAIADEKRDRENADTLLDTKISNVDTRVTNLNSTVTSQGTSLSSLQSTVNSHGNSISTLQSTVSSQGNSISTLNSTVSSQGTAISTLQSTVAAQGNSISTLNSEYASLLAEINDLKRRVTALEQRI